MRVRTWNARCADIVSHDRCQNGAGSSCDARWFDEQGRRRRLGVHEHTVGKWRRRFLKERIEGLLDEARPGRPRTIDDDRVAAVIEHTLPSTPDDATHWSIRSMANHIGAFPHHDPPDLDGIRFAAAPQRDLQTVNRPAVRRQGPRHRRALPVAARSGVGPVRYEKSQIQALDREQPVLPMMPGMPERRTHSYVRHGTTSLFAALDIATGFVIGKCYKRHRATEFLDFLKQIDARLPTTSTSTSSWTTTPPTKRRDQGVVGETPALPRPLHPDVRVLDQSGRTLVRRAHTQETAPRRPHLDPPTRG